MDLRSLRLFLSLSETLNFSRTAESLHLSLSSVSRGLQRLEDEVGQRLFERDNRRVELTPAGVRFTAYAREAVLGWDNLMEEFSGEEALEGEISVYSSLTATHAIISPILEQFRRRHPRIDIKLHTGDQADAVARIQQHNEDLAIAARGEELPRGMSFSVLQYSPLLFICPRVPCVLSELLDDADVIDEHAPWTEMPLVIAERGLARARFIQWLQDRELSPPVYAQVSGHEAIVSMVALGLGVSVVPKLVIDNSPNADKVRVLEMRPMLEDFAVGICALDQRLEYPLVRAFWDVARASYPTPA